MDNSGAIPVTVLGGWLGVGKTTMVNRILGSATERVAVIVNDVGEVNIDAQLIRGDNPDGDVLELTNGCICCKVGDDLYATLADLSRRDPAPERVVVEASGVAEPRQAASFLEHPRFRVDAVITLAVGKGFEYRSSGPPYGSLMRAQVSGADLVVATKLDLLEQGDTIDASLDELRSFTKAPVIAAQGGSEWINAVILGAHQNPDHRQPDGSTVHVATATWHQTRPITIAEVKGALSHSGLLRAKGSLATETGEAIVVHLAGNRVDITPLGESETPNEALVLIGESHEQVNAAVTALG